MAGGPLVCAEEYACISNARGLLLPMSVPLCVSRIYKLHFIPVRSVHLIIPLPVSSPPPFLPPPPHCGAAAAASVGGGCSTKPTVQHTSLPPPSYSTF
jgi:hypothetical protein